RIKNFDVEQGRIICDTDVLIDYLEADKPRHLQTKEIIGHKIGLDNVVISIISKMELIAGAANKNELRVINKNIYYLSTLLINPEISSISFHLIEKYKLSHNLNIPDAIVAATSIYAKLPLFT